MEKKKKKPCTYTVMLVPHSGQGVKQLHIPDYFLKGLSVFAAGAVLTSMTMFLHYSTTVNRAQAEKAELQHLREINNVQITQIQQLAQSTMSIQEDMKRLNSLDIELRKMNGMEANDNIPVSRSGTSRPAVTNPSGPQGGLDKGPELKQLRRTVEQLKSEAKGREASLIMLRDAIAAKQAQIAATPTIWPTAGQITSGFGWRRSPWSSATSFHEGVDIANDWGAPIYAAADGVVVFVGWNGGYGKMVVIDHGNGISTAYAHNASNHVNIGEYVSKGEHIADLGSTGASTGPHVHYEVRIGGERVDPTDYM
jgi:murein DD-endopeptidase MepM/ murein hydrolase activator NlpD